MKQIKKFILSLNVLLCVYGQAQKQGNIWYFGNGCGLDFNSGVPVALSGGQTGSDNPPGMVQEGTACISDSSGALLFYSGGKTIWNRFNKVMPNGTGIFGGISSSQAALILPKPGNDSLFYLFTTDEFQHINASYGYRYTLVNMCLDSARGDVVPIEKNVLLMDSCTEKLAACRDASQTGYWILGHKMFSDEFRAWHLTSGGITSAVSSKVGTKHGYNASNNTWVGQAGIGQMKFNPQGTKIGLAVGNINPSYTELFDFDNSTGIVSNSCRYTPDSALGKFHYGVEFSPDGSKMYVTGHGGSGGVRLYQFNVIAGSCQAIEDSLKVMFPASNTFINGLQLGPDNKIYVVCNSYQTLGTINSPNLSGNACNLTVFSFSINGQQNNYSLPAMLAGYHYSNTMVDCCTVPQLTVSASFPIVCAGITVTLDATGANSYNWSTGSAGQQVTVSPQVTTTYSVNGFNDGSCSRQASISVEVLPCTGINQLATEEDHLLVYPNPSAGEFIVDAINATLAVYNAWGQVILTSVIDGKTLFDLNEPGIYYLRVQLANNIKKYRLIVSQ